MTLAGRGLRHDVIVATTPGDPPQRHEMILGRVAGGPKRAFSAKHRLSRLRPVLGKCEKALKVGGDLACASSRSRFGLGARIALRFYDPVAAR